MYHSYVKMKFIDVESNYYAEYSVESTSKDSKFKIAYHVRTSKHKNIFVKWYAPNCSAEVFAVSKIKNTVPSRYVIMVNLNGI